VGVDDLRAVLGDTSLSRTERLTRLQGWRGEDAERAERAVVAQRIGPATCAVGALLGAVLQSPPLLGVLAATALVGALAPNHPFEMLYNRRATRRGGTALPPNRAAKRLGCAIGVVFLGGAAVAYAAGAAPLGLVLALVLASTAAFVAITGMCVPSMIFTILWGSERACAPNLLSTADRHESYRA
jgi:hypothetical protein